MGALEQIGSRPAADFPRGVALLRDPLLNKGTAFTERERDCLRLRGLLPANLLQGTHGIPPVARLRVLNGESTGNEFQVTRLLEFWCSAVHFH